MVYILDTNGFIFLVNGLNRAQALLIIQWIEKCYQDGIIISIEQVRQELLPVIDILHLWAITWPPVFEPSTDDLEQAVEYVREATLLEVEKIGYSDDKISTFFDGADPYLIAKAILDDGCVVTNEAPIKSGKIQIPQICKRLGVRCINTDTMLAELEPEHREVPLALFRISDQAKESVQSQFQ